MIRILGSFPRYWLFRTWRLGHISHDCVPQSQMTQLMDYPRWPTLHDVSNGEFLACFLRDYEVFHRYQLCGDD
jgi:hypothetical protein